MHFFFLIKKISMVTVLRSIELLPYLVKSVAQMTLHAQIPLQHLNLAFSSLRNMGKERKRTRT